jgi:hypothetical protein
MDELDDPLFKAPRRKRRDIFPEKSVIYFWVPR